MHLAAAGQPAAEGTGCSDKLVLPSGMLVHIVLVPALCRDHAGCAVNHLGRLYLMAVMILVW